MKVHEKVYRFLKRDSFNEGEVREVEMIGTIEEKRNVEISYNKMQGRPSILVSIRGVRFDCLLDTGARINVMSMEGFRKLGEITLQESEEKLQCANDSSLETCGKIRVEVEVAGVCKEVTFIIVEKLVPDLIGGIEFQDIFGYELRKKCLLTNQEQREKFVCNIEAKFGRQIQAGERLRHAMEILEIGNDQRLTTIIRDNEDVFMADKWDIGCTHLMKHRIITKGGPINIKPYRQPMNLEERIEEAIKNLYDNGIIRKCNSQWNTPLICVWKKEKADIRLCLDFRQLNAVTERQAFPMPNVDEMLDALEGSKYFSSIDLGNAYYQVELSEDSQEKTAFSTKQGQYCFNRMPFGIAAAPGTFQEMMNKVIGKIKGAMVYLDDILIFTETRDRHYEIIRTVLTAIKNAGLRVNPEKCQFLRDEIKFLGHVISQEGVKTDPTKIEAIKDFGKPKCVKKMRSFLGICNYYRKFIKDYSKKARSLEQLCSGPSNKKIEWTSGLEEVFNGMKEALMMSPILCFPDINKEFILDTDASFDTIGAVLSQKDNNGRERVIAYGSHAMTSHEKGYCTTRKELLAIYYFCIHFKHYLYGRRFILRTDHKAITFMLNTKKPITSQFQTWINYLSSLDMKLEYRKGTLHTNADMLSRSKCDTCAQCLMTHEDPKSGRLKTRMLNTVDIQEKSEGSNEGTLIPDDKINETILEVHYLLCHAGAEKVAAYMEKKFKIERLRSRVQEIVRSCVTCQKTKVLTTATKTKRNKLNQPTFLRGCS